MGPFAQQMDLITGAYNYIPFSSLKIHQGIANKPPLSRTFKKYLLLFLFSKSSSPSLPLILFHGSKTAKKLLYHFIFYCTARVYFSQFNISPVFRYILSSVISHGSCHSTQDLKNSQFYFSRIGKNASRSPNCHYFPIFLLLLTSRQNYSKNHLIYLVGFLRLAI